MNGVYLLFFHSSPGDADSSKFAMSPTIRTGAKTRPGASDLSVSLEATPLGFPYPYYRRVPNPGSLFGAPRKNEVPASQDHRTSAATVCLSNI